ncbi:Zn-ribbon domain-containing OB-fold protein [Actinomadura macra]|uniref:Zn-ribbon domain-containing OB-fold protein n=1 Tax=Actinomadura macra TaxID=46164 RepID=UPI0008373F63|nr:OB-fold domain-containing protein [Actinomadura macra]
MDVAAYAKLLPDITPSNKPFWDGCAAGELRLQQCSDCGRHRFPDAPICPQCLSGSASWAVVSGKGTVWSWCTMHQKYFAAFADEVPYRLVYVRLAEGPLVISTLADESAEPHIDQPVRAVFRPSPGGRVVLQFSTDAANVS